MEEQSQPVSQPPPQPIQPEVKKPFSKKVVFLVLGVVLMGLIVGGGVMVASRQNKTAQVSPTPTVMLSPTIASDPMADWKTYTNNQYTFQYPSSWTVTPEISDSVVFENMPVQQPNAQGGTFSGGRVQGKISMMPIESVCGVECRINSSAEFYDLSNKNLWRVGSNMGGGPGLTQLQPLITRIGGKQAVQVTSHPSTSYEGNNPTQITDSYYTYLGPNNMMVISFEYDTGNPSYMDLTQQFNQILSTFKFTNQTLSPTVTISSLKTYTGSGFSFQYSGNWYTSSTEDGSIVLDNKPVDGTTITHPNQVPILVNVVTDPNLINTYRNTQQGSGETRPVNGKDFEFISIANSGGMGASSGNTIVAQTYQNNILYRFTLTNRAYRNEFDEIISTFKSTN